MSTTDELFAFFNTKGFCSEPYEILIALGASYFLRDFAVDRIGFRRATATRAALVQMRLNRNPNGFNRCRIYFLDAETFRLELFTLRKMGGKLIRLGPVKVFPKVGRVFLADIFEAQAGVPPQEGPA